MGPGQAVNMLQSLFGFLFKFDNLKNFLEIDYRVGLDIIFMLF